MGHRYAILAKDYKDKIWKITFYTNSKFLMIKTLIKALFRYELINFCVRK